ncbi:hypothetical protein evm_012833 [Chilo suppressalis]|nr:hypothetical protein evm_012833 [Chilo suppressalis]
MERIAENSNEENAYNEYPNEEPDSNEIDYLGGQSRNPPIKLTIEITLFLSFMALSIAAAPAANLLMYRTCVHALGHSVEECESFLAPGKTNHTQELENAVQQYATFVGTAKSVLESAVPALLSVFIGVWSDKHGRKPLLTIPLLGELYHYHHHQSLSPLVGHRPSFRMEQECIP